MNTAVSYVGIRGKLMAFGFSAGYFGADVYQQAKEEHYSVITGWD